MSGMGISGVGGSTYYQSPAVPQQSVPVQQEQESLAEAQDKAKDLDVITEEEYEVKLTSARKKLDNFELLRKVEMQYEMDIITKEEYEEKVRNIMQ